MCLELCKSVVSSHLFCLSGENCSISYISLIPVNLHQDAGALNALCLYMPLFTNRLNETGQNESGQTIYHSEGQGFFIRHIINYTGYNQKWNVNQIRSTQWTVQKNKKNIYIKVTTQEHIYGKKREIKSKMCNRIKSAKQIRCAKTVYSQASMIDRCFSMESL